MKTHAVPAERSVPWHQFKHALVFLEEQLDLWQPLRVKSRNSVPWHSNHHIANKKVHYYTHLTSKFGLLILLSKVQTFQVLNTVAVPLQKSLFFCLISFSVGFVSLGIKQFLLCLQAPDTSRDGCHSERSWWVIVVGKDIQVFTAMHSKGSSSPLLCSHTALGLRLRRRAPASPKLP